MRGNYYSEEVKEQVLREVEETGNMTLVARNHNIPSTTINTWVKKKKDAAKAGFARGPKSSNFNSINSNKEMEKENDLLKKTLGEKDLEIAILKDLLKKKSFL